MSIFVYKATNVKGKDVKGEVEANNSADAIASLRKKGLFPTSVVEKTASQAQETKKGFGEIKLFEKKTIDAKEFVAFLRQFSTLVNAGLPLLRCLKVLYEQQKEGLLKTTVRDLANSVESGTALSECLARYPNLFEKLFINMVKAGEIAGILGTVLERLSEFYEKSEKLKAKVKTAMIYPLFVVFVSLGVVGFLITFIVPKFAVMFVEMNLELPAITSFLITMSDFVQERWYVFLIMIVGFVATLMSLKKSEKGRKRIDKLKLTAPVIGDLTKKVATSRFARTLGTLLNSGVPILQALNIVKDTVGNEVVADVIVELHDNVREGESMVVPLRESKVFHPMVVNMVEVGEETGKISEMLTKIADIYDDEVDNAVTAMTSLMEPVLIVGLALIVGFIVIAMFLPLISIISGISGG